MRGYTHILIPVDFTETTSDVIDTAIAIAEKFDAKITVMHAFFVYPFAYAGGLYVPSEDITRKAQEVLDATRNDIRLRYPNTDSVLATTDARDAILEIARTRGADLIVMGTHGRRGVSRALLGSVAEHVVRFSPIHVLTVSRRNEPKEKT
ncbi:universal stress protein [Pendulispora brunnea]|uniref:Universal stress protein n=1 Tax=Pendulispora brunnea TaxID=2905690 RepID=A0ABZ2K651_9BACT